MTVVNYCVNSRPFYLRMCLNSIKMLRSYNSTIPIKLFLIEENEPTVALAQFAELQVEVIRKSWRSPEDNFFLLNKTYLCDLEEDRVLYIDVDTFIFGDVAVLFDKYADVDFVGCPNDWVIGDKWELDFLSRPTTPFNGGVLLFNNGWHRGRAEEWIDLTRNLPGRLAEWLEKRNAAHNREEMAISEMVVRSASYRYFDRSDCYNVLWPQDLEHPEESIIFHTYAANWRPIFNKLRGSATNLKLPRRIVSGN